LRNEISARRAFLNFFSIGAYPETKPKDLIEFSRDVDESDRIDVVEMHYPEVLSLILSP
jgi:hypothetical protein